MSNQAKRYLDVTQAAGRDFIQRGLQGPVVMLNLIRLRAVADYSASPELAPATPITGAEAFRRYIAHTLPHLHASGGQMLFLGDGGTFLIGPPDERWDLVALIRQSSVDTFLAFAQNADYLRILGHRTAAVEDSRLLALSEASGLTA